MRAILYALLSQKAIHDGLSVHLWVYTLAKALDAQVGGRGWIEIEDLEQVYPRSRRSLLRIIKEGQNTFWRVDERADHLYLRSLIHLGVALETTLGDPIYIDTDRIQRLQLFKAHAYSAFYGQAKTITRGKLCILYGVSKQTLSKWEKLTNIQKTTNLGKMKIKHRKDIENAPGIDQPGVWRWGDALFWQLPNTFHLDDPDLAPRHVRCNRAIKHTLKAERVPACRLYYSRRDRATLRVFQGEQPFAYVHTPGLLGKRRIWEFVHA